MIYTINQYLYHKPDSKFFNFVNNNDIIDDIDIIKLSADNYYYLDISDIYILAIYIDDIVIYILQQFLSDSIFEY